jgi:hypothetical protein
MESNKKIVFVITFLIMMLIIGTFSYHNIEGWNYIDSMYFSATTLATVGFGDIHPITLFGKLFTIFYIFIGVSSALYAFTLLAQHYFETHTERFSNTMSKMRVNSSNLRERFNPQKNSFKDLKNRLKPDKEEIINSTRNYDKRDNK